MDPLKIRARCGGTMALTLIFDPSDAYNGSPGSRALRHHHHPVLKGMRPISASAQGPGQYR